MFFFFFFNDTATTEIYTLSLHDALPIYYANADDEVETRPHFFSGFAGAAGAAGAAARSEEHTSELQSLRHLVCRLLLEKKKKKILINDKRLYTHNKRSNKVTNRRLQDAS